MTYKMEKERDAESADGSETSSKSLSIVKIPYVKPIMKPNTTPRFDIFTNVAAIIFFCIFIAGLIVVTHYLNTIIDRTSKIENQNDRNLAEMVLLRLQYQNMESELKNGIRGVSEPVKVLQQQNDLMRKEFNDSEEVVTTTVMFLNQSTQLQQTEQVTTTPTNPTTTTKKIVDIIEKTENHVKPTTPMITKPTTTQETPSQFELKTPYFNAASFLSGASVITHLSSRPVNSSESSFDQSDYILLEREPVPD